jgi:hypothetical protein
MVHAACSGDPNRGGPAGAGGAAGARDASFAGATAGVGGIGGAPEQPNCGYTCTGPSYYGVNSSCDPGVDYCSGVYCPDIHSGWSFVALCCAGQWLGFNISYQTPACPSTDASTVSKGDSGTDAAPGEGGAWIDARDAPAAASDN